MEIRSITIPFSKHKVLIFRRRESDLQRRVEELDKQICNSSDLLNLDFELKEYERLKRELHNLYETKGKGACSLKSKMDRIW